MFLKRRFLLLPLLLAIMAGCGGSSISSTPVAEEDELAKYVAENPDLKQTDPGKDGGDDSN